MEQAHLRNAGDGHAAIGFTIRGCGSVDCVMTTYMIHPDKAGRRVRLDMLSTCVHVTDMSKMIQIRHVPDVLHRRLKIRAAEADMTLSDYIKQELELMAARPTLAEMAARLSVLTPVDLGEPVVEILRDARDAR